MKEMEIVAPEKRAPVWDRAGKAVKTGSVLEAIKDAGFDWEVEKRPLMYRGANGNAIRIPDRFAVVRTSDGAALGANVGKGYQVHQNEEALGFVQDYADATGAEIRSVWERKGGAVVGMTLRLPTQLFVGPQKDPLFKELVMNTSHDGTLTMGGETSLLRQICTNGMTRQVIRGAKWSIRHTLNSKRRFEFIKEDLMLAEARFAEFEAKATNLAEKKLSDEQLKNLLMQALPDNRNREEHTARIVELFQSSPTLDNVRGTSWAAVQAVSEYFEWARPQRDERSRVNATLYGPGRNMTATVLEALAA